MQQFSFTSHSASFIYSTGHGSKALLLSPPLFHYAKHLWSIGTALMSILAMGSFSHMKRLEQAKLILWPFQLLRLSEERGIENSMRSNSFFILETFISWVSSEHSWTQRWVPINDCSVLFIFTKVIALAGQIIIPISGELSHCVD